MYIPYTPIKACSIDVHIDLTALRIMYAWSIKVSDGDCSGES